MMSSAIPSPKYSCSGSPLILSKARTAMDVFLSVVAVDGPHSRRRRADYAIGAHRFDDVLQGLRAEIRESDTDLVLDVIERRARNDDTPRFSKRFEPRGDVDTVTVEIAALHHDVAEIDADAQNECRSSGCSIFAAAMPCCNSTAHCTALTALANSTSTPSPTTLKTRPSCFVISGPQHINGAGPSIPPAYRPHPPPSAG